MKQVLKIRFDREDGYVGNAYVQQVTENVIVIIMNENETVQFLRKDGTRRFKSSSSMRLIDIDKVNSYLEKKYASIKNWHGHWKPKLNARGELVNTKMKSLEDFNFDYDEWFNSQGVEVINLIKGNIQVKKERVPHPFEYQGYVYDGPVKVKIESNDTEESVKMKVEMEKLRLRGHNSIAEQKARA